METTINVLSTHVTIFKFAFKDKKTLTFDLSKLVAPESPKVAATEFLNNYSQLVSIEVNLRNAAGQLEADTKIRYAELDSHFREHWNTENMGKMTEGGVAAQIKSDSDYTERQTELREMQKTLNIVTALLNACRTKYDLLQTLIYNPNQLTINTK